MTSDQSLTASAAASRVSAAPRLQRETLINALVTVGLLAVPVAAMLADNPFYITLATKIAIFALAGVGLNIALGYGGLISFGHAAFFGIGGYAAGILAFHAQNYDPLFSWPFEFLGTTSMPIIWVTAICLSAVAAVFIGALSLRTGGAYFIMITLAFAQMFYYFTISWTAYGGEDGLSIYTRNKLAGLNTFDPLTFYTISLIVLGLAMWVAHSLQRSRFGLALATARQNAQRLTSIGIHPFRVRLAAFIISGMITGLAGALYADLNRFVSPTMFSWQISGEIMIFVILGGIGRLYGPIVGAAIFFLLEHLLGPVTQYWLFLLGLLLLITILYARGGVIGVLAGEKRDG